VQAPVQASVSKENKNPNNNKIHQKCVVIVVEARNPK
jgi:hypothetical protein